MLRYLRGRDNLTTTILPIVVIAFAIPLGLVTWFIGGFLVVGIGTLSLLVILLVVSKCLPQTRAVSPRLSRTISLDFIVATNSALLGPATHEFAGTRITPLPAGLCRVDIEVRDDIATTQVICTFGQRLQDVVMRPDDETDFEVMWLIDEAVERDVLRRLGTRAYRERLRRIHNRVLSEQVYRIHDSDLNRAHGVAFIAWRPGVTPVVRVQEHQLHITFADVLDDDEFA